MKSLNNVSFNDSVYGIAVAYVGTQQLNLPNAAYTQLNLSVINFNPNNELYFDNYTAPVTGWYQINAQADLFNTVSSATYYLYVKINTDFQPERYTLKPNTAVATLILSRMYHLNAGDKLSVWVYNSDGIGTTDMDSGGSGLSIFLVRRG